MTTNAFNFMDSTAFDEAIAESTKLTQALREESKAEYEKRLKEDTLVISVVTSNRGFVGYAFGLPVANQYTAPIVGKSVFNDGTKMTTPQACFAGLAKALTQGMSAGRKHFEVFLQSSEKSRMVGLVSKAQNGSHVMLKEGELKFINAHRAYGQGYITTVSAAGNVVFKAVKEGFEFHIMDHSEAMPIELKGKLPGEIADAVKSAKFIKGTANITARGKVYTLTMANEALSGTFNLLNSNGLLTVERPLKEGSVRAVGAKLFSGINAKIAEMANSAESAPASTEEAVA